MRIIQALTAAGLLWLAAFATPAAAQTFEQQQALCDTEVDGLLAGPASREFIGACTAIIDSGRLDGQALVRALYQRGNATFYSRVLNSDQVARLDFSEAIRLNPQFAPAYLVRGMAYMREFNPSSALGDFEHVIRLNPRFARGYTERARAYIALNLPERAAADRAEAARLCPGGLLSDASPSCASRP